MKLGTYSIWNPKPQCNVCLSYWDIGVVYCSCGHFLRNGNEENKKYVKYTMNVLSIPSHYIKFGWPHGHRYGKKPGDRRILHREFAQEEMQEERLLGYPRPVHSRGEVPQEYVWRRTRWRNVSWDGQSGGRGPHHLNSEEFQGNLYNWWIRSNTVSWFRYDARKASTWLQTSIVSLASFFSRLFFLSFFFSKLYSSPSLRSVFPLFLFQ